MKKITEVVSINASPKKVMDYIAKIEDHPAFISALKAVESISGDQTQPGTTWNWTFVMSGVEIHGNAELVKYEPEKVYSFKTTNGIDSTFTYTVEPEEEGCRLTIQVDYEMPDSVMAKVADSAVVERLNESEAERAGENLKAILEA